MGALPIPAEARPAVPRDLFAEAFGFMDAREMATALLPVAVRRRDLGAVIRLLEAGADPNANNGEPLAIAASLGERHIMAALAIAGADVTGAAGERALMKAAAALEDGAVDLLIFWGASPERAARFKTLASRRSITALRGLLYGVHPAAEFGVAADRLAALDKERACLLATIADAAKRRERVAA